MVSKAVTEKPIGCGDYVRHILTGYEGTVIARTEWLNGCIRIEVQSHKLGKDGEPAPHHGFDIQEIERIKRPRGAREIPLAVKPREAAKPGGPRDVSAPRAISRRR